MSGDKRKKQVFRRPTEQPAEPPDRYEAMTVRYSYLKEKREASKPSLYGAGIDLYEEERIMREQMSDW